MELLVVELEEVGVVALVVLMGLVPLFKVPFVRFVMLPAGTVVFVVEFGLVAFGEVAFVVLAGTVEFGFVALEEVALVVLAGTVELGLVPLLMLELPEEELPLVAFVALVTVELGRVPFVVMFAEVAFPVLFVVEPFV